MWSLPRSVRRRPGAAGARCRPFGGSVTVVGVARVEGIVPMRDMVRRGIAMQGTTRIRGPISKAALAGLADRPPALDWVTTLRLKKAQEGFRRPTYTRAPVARLCATSDAADAWPLAQKTVAATLAWVIARF